MMRSSDSIEVLISRLPEKRAKSIINRIKKHNITTLEQLHGAINPQLPPLSESSIRKKGLNQSFQKIQKKSTQKSTKLKRLKSLTGLSEDETLTLYNEITSVRYPVSSNFQSGSNLSLGYVKKGRRMRTTFWRNTKASKYTNDKYIIPNYDNTGPIFYQGERGTCVANAACSLSNYISGKKYSRQFLYHQCKMIDGITETEGTYISLAIYLMSDTSLIDKGVVEEEKWRYNSIMGNTTHQGPPPEACFNSNRFIGKPRVFIRQHNVINDIKSLLHGGDGRKPVPVVVGLTLFESFENPSSNRTGWVTMPLPGEREIGGHAMLVVGYYEKEQVFLVRNSWGSWWASQNKYGFRGHALIPYDYFKLYIGEGGSTFNYEEMYLSVPERKRLYKTRHAMKPSGKIAAADSGRPKRKKKKRSPGKTFFYLIATGILAWAAYYFFYEDHSFSDIWFDIADWFEDLY